MEIDVEKKGTRAGEGAGGEGEEEEGHRRRRPLSPLPVARPVAAGWEEWRRSWLRSGGGEWGMGK